MRRLHAMATATALTFLSLPTSCSSSSSSYTPPLTGIRKKDLPAYKGATFSCASDPSHSIPSAYINDDYCDCRDGSDEPGTSACAGVKGLAAADGAQDGNDGNARERRFYCANKGSTPKVLPSSRVSDGVCDCCDGTDEPHVSRSSPLWCSNTCEEEGRGVRDELTKKLNEATAGLNARRALVNTANALLSGKREEKFKFEQEEAEKLAQMEDLKKKKEAAEEIEKQERERREEEERQEEERHKEASGEGGEADTKEPEQGEGGDMAEGDSGQEAEEEKGEIPGDEKQGAQAEETKAENFPYPEEYRFDKTAGAEADNTASAELTEGEDEGDQQADNFPYPDEYRVKEEQQGKEEGQVESEEEQDADDREAPAVEAVEEEKPKAADYRSDEAEQARADFSKAEREHRAVKDKLDQVQKELDTDYGTDDVFAALRDQCFTVQHRQYTYEVCPFGKAAQKEGSSSTSLGTFDAWEDNHKVMKFTGGQTCWNGPARSLEVALHCSSTAYIANVQEPSKCVYTIDMFSPVACSQGQVEEADRALQAFLSGEEDVQHSTRHDEL